MKAPDAASLREGGKGPEAPAGSVAGDSLPATGSGAKALPKIPQKEAKLMAQKMTRLEEKGKPELKDQYILCKTQQEKRIFFYNVYLLDPEVSSKKIRKLDSDKQKEQVSTWKAGGPRSRLPRTKAFCHTWTTTKPSQMPVWLACKKGHMRMSSWQSLVSCHMNTPL